METVQATASTLASEEPSEFYIPATTSVLETRPRTLKHGDTFAVFDHQGDIAGAQRGSEGLFHNDTRYLSRLELTLDGHRPLLLSSNLSNDNATLTVDLANPDIERDGRIILSREKIHILRTKFLWRSGCYERLAIRNFDRMPQSVRVTLRFAADFVDLFEIRGSRREHRGIKQAKRVGDDAIEIRYRGLDACERVTQIEFAPTPTTLSEDAACFDLSLGPGARAQIFLTVRCDVKRDAKRGEFFVAMRDARRAQRAATRHFALVDSSSEILNLIVCRSISDLYMLITDTPQGPYPYAGIPWFSTAFGRDGIITALQLLWLDPTIAKGVLRFLAATQATKTDPESAAEPGKILHETRRGEMALLGEVPFRLYYGTVDATPLFVLLAARYFERTGDVETIVALWPHIVAALRWIDSYGDADGDGFVEYPVWDGKGLRNQGWKDSADSIFDEAGNFAEGAIALCEVQAYVYAAKRGTGAIARALGDAATATRLAREAEALRLHFEQAFWCEELGTYAIALDGDKRPCRVRSSNAGHVLFGGIASPERAARTAATLLGRESYSGWGVRTLAASEPRYNPMSYHNGSVWPHDNSLIALGFARYGLKQEALRLFAGMFNAIEYMDLQRPPELFCGFDRRRDKAPTLYPVACAPQAWASGAPLAFLESCLGLVCDRARNEIRFERPVLPASVDELRIRRLRLGDGEIDVLLRRHQSDVAVIVLRRRGDVRVVVVN
ncbi:MAG TPA: amylo-alpha-1,6-glucosidase [Stellaceae bacterium]|jgi:glycogen debranching enzyme